MIKNVFCVALIILFFLISIKCEYVENEKSNKFGGDGEKKKNNNYKRVELAKNEEIFSVHVNFENNEINGKNDKDKKTMSYKYQNGVEHFQNEISKYENIIDTLILRNVNRKKYDFYNILEEYSLHTKISGEVYDQLLLLINIIKNNNILTKMYNRENGEMNEVIFKNHLIFSIFKWHSFIKIIEGYNKNYFVYYIDKKNMNSHKKKIYSYKYFYNFLLNGSNSEQFIFYINLNKISFLQILDKYNKYMYIINSSKRNYPHHMYNSENFSVFIYSYFLNSNKSLLNKYMNIIKLSIWKNIIFYKNGNIYNKIGKFDKSLILYNYEGIEEDVVLDYTNTEIGILFSNFSKLFIDIINDVHAVYYEELLREKKTNEKGIKKNETTSKISTNNSESNNIDNKKKEILKEKEMDKSYKKKTEEKTEKKLDSTKDEDKNEKKIDPFNNDMDNEYIKERDFFFKNLNKIFNFGLDKEGDEISDYRNLYELRDGFIINKKNPNKQISLIFNPTKDIFYILNHINKKKNFKEIYDYLKVIIKFEGNNFYDNRLICNKDCKNPFFKKGVSKNRVGKKNDKWKGSLFNVNNMNDINQIANNILMFGTHIPDLNKKEKKNNYEQSENNDIYEGIKINEQTPAAKLTKDIIHDQLKLLKNEYIDRLKNEAICVLGFLYLIGINDNNGKLKFPYGFPRNIENAIRLIKKGNDGLCNFLSGILYHINLPAFVNNSMASLSTEMSNNILEDSNIINNFFYLYYKNNSDKVKVDNFLSNENRIIPNKIDNIKSKIISYSLGSTKDDIFSRLAYTNNILRIKYKNGYNNDMYLKEYFDYTYDKKTYKHSYIKNNISPFLTSCDFLLRNILGGVVDSLKYSSSVENGIYQEYIHEHNKHILVNGGEENRNLFEYFSKLADNKNPYALAALGEIYYFGNDNIGIERNEMKALDFWKKAADQGDTASALSSGYVYLDEYKRLSKKLEITKSMDKKELIRQIKMEKKGKSDNDEEKKENDKAQNQGEYITYANINTGVGTASVSNTGMGTASVPSVETGSAPSNMASGESNSMNSSSINYSNGVNIMNVGNADPMSIPPSEPQVVRGITNEIGNVRSESVRSDDGLSYSEEAMINEYMRELGNETDSVMKNAEKYFQKATKNNEGSIEHLLAKYNIYKFGLGTKKDLKLAGEYLKKAADKGDNISQMLIGHYYSGSDVGIELKNYNPNDVINNLKMSYKYYSLSARNGNIISLYNKNILILKGIDSKYKSFDEKCDITLKPLHFIGMFNDRIYGLSKLLKRNYKFKDYTGALLVSIILSEIGDHPNNVNASMLWGLKKNTMKKFMEKFNRVENILEEYKLKVEDEKSRENNFGNVIKKIYKKEKEIKYKFLKKNEGRYIKSLLKYCSVMDGSLENLRMCQSLRREFFYELVNSRKNKVNNRIVSKTRGSEYPNFLKTQIESYKPIELFEKYDDIILKEMENGKTNLEKIRSIEKIKKEIMEYFRLSEYLHCYYKPMSYYQVKLLEEKEKERNDLAKIKRNKIRNIGKGMIYENDDHYFFKNGKKNKNIKNLYDLEFYRYSMLLYDNDIKEIYNYKNKYSSKIFNEIQSFSENCDVCKQYYDIYSSFYGYKKATINLIKKYKYGDNFTIKSKIKELQLLTKSSDERNHELLYYKAIFLEDNNLETLESILEIYFKLSTDEHSACNVIGILRVLKILFKKIVTDFGWLLRNVISFLSQMNSFESFKINEKLKKNNIKPYEEFAFIYNRIYNPNLCYLQNNFFYISEYNQKCLNLEYLLNNNYIYSQYSYFHILKFLKKIILSFFQSA
ncbi:conserved Plasmodium protein, unknown function [Plasmodium vinckei vinckei]|uniref:Sel1 repeat-containing protein n=1 Tax=Plasmodium vinckei vinckei TaxID=54757 RepID=A0A449BMR8_PLAVN|nr:conserved Plasmodium protein, unknown function [Plasmodium vinckei vinckei]VEV54756.1 conserved Plasmodium protein, unknown function [Plasmodium vinckei vinckei]